MTQDTRTYTFMYFVYTEGGRIRVYDHAYTNVSQRMCGLRCSIRNSIYRYAN